MTDLHSLTYSLFPTDNAFEIPTLRLDMQPDKVDVPFLAYGEQGRKTDLGGYGSMHFYVDDYRFNAVFDKPSTIIDANPRNIVEPNFSCYVETPIAVGMQQIYRKRAVARYCQDHGIRVFVDLNVNHKFYKVNMLGVPKGYAAFATRGYSDRLEYLEFEYNIAKEWAEGNPLTFVVYGGGAKCKDFAQKHGCCYLTPWVKVKTRRKAIERIREDVALFPTDDLITPTIRQLEDYSAKKTLKKMTL